MKDQKSKFKIAESKGCPIYETGDRFLLSNFILTPPRNKPTCLVLTKAFSAYADMFNKEQTTNDNTQKRPQKEFNCGGCRGIVKLIYIEEEKYHTVQMKAIAEHQKKKEFTQKLASFDNYLRDSFFFKPLEDNILKEIVTRATLKKFDTGEIILSRGETGKYLHILIGGKVALLDDNNNSIGFLRKGDVFGEMSLLTGQAVCVTIEATEPVTLLLLKDSDLDQLLVSYPFLQTLFTQLLVHRLSAANKSLSALEITPGMTGRLEDVAVTEFFQMMHENSKTGTVKLTLEKGNAVVVFVEGEIIQASFDEKNNVEAFFAILKENKGQFHFSANLPEQADSQSPIGGFMKLLMAGLQQIDEESPEPSPE